MTPPDAGTTAAFKAKHPDADVITEADAAGALTWWSRIQRWDVVAPEYKPQFEAFMSNVFLLLGTQEEELAEARAENERLKAEVAELKEACVSVAGVRRVTKTGTWRRQEGL